MFNKKGLLTLLVVSTLFLTGCAANQVEEKKRGEMMESEVIKIGYIGALTGNAGALGQDSKAGVEYYFEKNPTINGKRVEVIYEDGRCNGQDAANAAQKLVNIDKVQVIIGGLCSGETLAIAPIVEQAKVAIVSAGSSSPEVTTAGDYIFRVYPSDDKVAQTMMDDIVRNNHSRIAILSEQTDFAQGYREVLKKLASENEAVEVVVDEAYAVDNSDFRTLLEKTKEAEADVLVSISQTPAGNGFTVKQAKELGLDIQIYGPDTIAGDDFFNIAKDAAEGVRQAVVAADPSREGFDEFVANAKPAQADVVFQTLAYDAAGVVAKAIEEVGYDGTKIKDYWYSMPVFNGLAGDHKFDENGDNLVPANIRVVKGGKYEVVSSK